MFSAATDTGASLVEKLPPHPPLPPAAPGLSRDPGLDVAGWTDILQMSLVIQPGHSYTHKASLPSNEFNLLDSSEFYGKWLCTFALL